MVVMAGSVAARSVAVAVDSVAAVLLAAVVGTAN
jgi:hypothetical protein